MDDRIVTKPRRLLAMPAMMGLLAAAMAPQGAPQFTHTGGDEARRNRRSAPPTYRAVKSRRYVPKVAATPDDHARLAKADAKRARKRQRNLASPISK